VSDDKRLRIAHRALGTVWLMIGLVGLMQVTSAAGGTVALRPSGGLPPLPSEPDSLQVQLLETLTRPTGISSYGSWAAWSRYDSAHRAYQLMVRNANGEVSAMGIAESPQPFEVSLGPLASGGVGAVYPRCANAVEHNGCSLEQLAIESTGARETRLAVPGGESLFRPALWKDTVAFLRAIPKGGERHPAEMFEWTAGSKHLKALALPRNSAAEVKEQPELRDTEGDIGKITALALNGTQVAYTRVAPWGEWAISNLWVQRPGHQPELIDSIQTGGGAGFGTRTYLTPTIAGSWLYAYRQYHERGLTGADGDPAWVRYSLTGSAAQQAQVSFDNREGVGGNEGPVDAVAPLGAGVIWTLQNSPDPSKEGACVLSFAGVKWRSIKRPFRP
jgi:hypothetical protein